MEENYLDLIENLLVENDVDVPNYRDPRKGITQYEAVAEVILSLIGEIRRIEAERFRKPRY